MLGCIPNTVLLIDSNFRATFRNLCQLKIGWIRKCASINIMRLTPVLFVAVLYPLTEKLRWRDFSYFCPFFVALQFRGGTAAPDDHVTIPPRCQVGDVQDCPSMPGSAPYLCHGSTTRTGGRELISTWFQCKTMVQLRRSCFWRYHVAIPVAVAEYFSHQRWHPVLLASAFEEGWAFAIIYLLGLSCFIIDGHNDTPFCDRIARKKIAIAHVSFQLYWQLVCPSLPRT